MKKEIVTVLLVLSSILNLNAQIINKADSTQWVTKQFFYDNGKLASEGFLHNGKPDGYWKSYYETGIIKSEGNRKNYLLDSVWKFYNDKGVKVLEYDYKEGKKNGFRRIYDAQTKKLISEEQLVDDVKNGISKIYHPNGKIKYLYHFIKGHEEGNAYEYDTTGTVITLLEYKYGITRRSDKINRRDQEGQKKDTWMTFYENKDAPLEPINIKTECTYLNDMKEGYLKEYALNGNLLRTTKYVKDKVINDAPELAKLDNRSTYYEGGILKSSGYYKNGVAEGMFKEFDKEGKITNVKIYKDGVVTGDGIVDEYNKEQGAWKEFYPTGELKATGTYKNGKKVGPWVYYFINGKIEQQGIYTNNGQPNGNWKWYFDNGNLLREENYNNGILEGETVEYDEAGKLITKGQYVDGQKEDLWEYELGNYKEVGKYKSDQRDGIWKHYYQPSGKLKFEGNFVDGNPDGKHVYYFENGKVAEQGKYSIGRKEGAWDYYDEEGLKYLTIVYKDDVEMKFDGVKVKFSDEPVR